MQRPLKLPVTAKRCQAQFAQHFQARTLVGFGKYHVESDQSGLVMVELQVNQGTVLIPSPRASDLRGKTFLINVGNDDTLLDANGHGQSFACVLSNQFKTLAPVRAYLIGASIRYALTRPSSLSDLGVR